MKQKQKRYVLAAVIAAVAVLAAYLLLAPAAIVAGAVAQNTTSGSASTPFGESIDITLGTNAQTSAKASWFAAVASSSQNVWTVNGTYKSQALVTLGYSLSVSYAQVSNIQIVSLYIKAVDNADSSSYTYTLANAKSLSGTSPISDSGSTTKSISQHLTDAAASAPATVKYYIYCRVQGIGVVSGQTLTAEITETYFATLQYAQSTESTSANITPDVTVASFLDELPTYGAYALACVGIVLLIVAFLPKKKVRK